MAHRGRGIRAPTPLGAVVVDPVALEERIRALAAGHPILRVKGFVHVTGKDIRLVVQAVGSRVQRYYDRPWRDGEERQSNLVVIGLKGLDWSAVTSCLGA